ncbi:MAG TPA: hypothetical protein VK507_24540 [Iamia sp.]|nr:hypothetical protein [Iamia sp.]
MGPGPHAARRGFDGATSAEASTVPPGLTDDLSDRVATALAALI